jgi:cation diffusion facilitator CzcD-associated flavoprotein CzcO
MPKPGCVSTEIAIVGSGFSGLGTAIRLKQRGYEDFVVLERADDVGGTWQANTYPGCRCDIPSHLYSFSFAPNPDWPETYSTQPDIWEYLRRCAEAFGVRQHVRLNCDVEFATWLEDERVWALETSQGTVRARVVIAGLGFLAEPRIPDLPGLDRFEGAVFHSSRWDHDFDVHGKRIASIGTGASAIQYVPAIQPRWSASTSSSARRHGSCRTRRGRSPASSAGSTGACRCSSASSARLSTRAVRRSCSGWSSGRR